MLIIDRFEGGFAVVETDNGIINIPKADIPSGAKEGDVLNIVIDSGETASRKKRLEEKMNSLFK
jgi:hypothetical protein